MMEEVFKSLTSVKVVIPHYRMTQIEIKILLCEFHLNTKVVSGKCTQSIKRNLFVRRFPVCGVSSYYCTISIDV